MLAGRGLYVHIPFCVSRCDYCAFATWAGADDRVDAYVDAVVAELKWRRSKGEICSPNSLYFGGGTPSLLPPQHISRIVQEAGVQVGSEVTIECNPESTTLDKLKLYKDCGVNRISLGLQSFSKEVLKSLGRFHDPEDIYPAVDAIGEVGFENYSVDLIYGAAAESLSILENTLQKVLELSPAPVHVSAYALTVEQNTPLARDPRRHPDEDFQADAYRLIDSMLSDSGLNWYEVSNWAKPDSYSRHNWNYWMQGEYVGLGCSAHSHMDSKRSWNIFNLNRYISVVSHNGDAVAGSEDVVGLNRVGEALELLVRTSVGVPTQAIANFDEIGFLCSDSEGITTLNLEGRLLANQVALRLDPSLVTLEQLASLQRSGPGTIQGLDNESG
ncbi:MAG: radical SAM family heme chaperone HemW [Actinomycetota bacterium]|nr:radical SAM family heme chaperone HemW [Actinomycetota bacterium]